MSPAALDEASILDLIREIYAAALDPLEWVTVLDRVSRALGAIASDFHFHEWTPERQVQLIPWGWRPEALDAYAKHFVAIDPWAAAMPHMRTGVLVSTREVIGDHELQRTELFNDWLFPEEICDGVIGYIDRDGEEAAAAVGFFRWHRGPLWGEAERALLQRLMPHLQQAIRIARRLGLSERKAAAVDQAIDRLALGVVLLGETGVVLHTNRAADAMLAEADGLVLDAHGLRALAPAERRALEAAVARALTSGTGSVVTVSRPSAKRPYGVAVCPLRRDARSPLAGGGPFAAALFVSDPERAAETDEGLVRRLFRLTRSEARVAVHIAHGLSPKEIAAALCTSIHTTRNHLKRVYVKTGVDGQASLVRVLMAAHPRLRADPPTST